MMTSFCGCRIVSYQKVETEGTAQYIAAGNDAQKDWEAEALSSLSHQGGLLYTPWSHAYPTPPSSQTKGPISGCRVSGRDMRSRDALASQVLCLR